jgi:hypothetical protein
VAVFSFVLIMLRCIGRDWHLADILGAATFCPLSDNSGQTWILAGDGLSAYDPKRTKLRRHKTAIFNPKSIFLSHLRYAEFSAFTNYA